MPKFFQTKEFKDMQKYWDDVLEQTGLVSPAKLLSDTVSRKFNDPIMRELATEYSSRLAAVRHNYKFKNDRDRIIWGHYCDGFKYKQIESLTGFTVEQIKHSLRCVKEANDLPKLREPSRKASSNKTGNGRRPKLSVE